MNRVELILLHRVPEFVAQARFFEFEAVGRLLAGLPRILVFLSEVGCDVEMMQSRGVFWWVKSGV